MKNLIIPLCILFLLALVLSLALFIYFEKHKKPVIEQFSIAEIRVVSDHEFEVKIEEKWIHTRLSAVPYPEAKNKVIEFLNTGSSATLVVKSRFENYWVVDIMVFDGNSWRSLTEWALQRSIKSN